MSTLKQKSTAILQEKENKIIPENIKSGVQIFDITGTLESGIDTSDATATETDLIRGKTAYVNGEKITGTIADLRGTGQNIMGVNVNIKDYSAYDELVFSGNSNLNNVVSDTTTYVSMEVTYNQLATKLGLTADKIKKDEIILGITGTLETGIDTSDATATAGDIIGGQTAYVNGEKIEGTIIDCREGSIEGETSISDVRNDTLYLSTAGDLPNDTAVIDGMSLISSNIPFSEVAHQINLDADDIRKDATVLGVVGTYEGIDTSDATATNRDIVEGKTAYVDGEKITGILSDFRGMMAEPAVIMDHIDYVFTEDNLVQILGGSSAVSITEGYIMDNDTLCNIRVPYSAVSSAIGLTADKIKKGVTILGITGTYEGDTPSYENLDEEVF